MCLGVKRKEMEKEEDRMKIPNYHCLTREIINKFFDRVHTQQNFPKKRCFLFSNRCGRWRNENDRVI